VFVFETGNKIVGILTGAFYKNSKKIYLFHLIVDEQYRRKGIGSRLFDYIDKLGKEQGFKIIFFYSEINNKKTHDLAEKKGYTKSKQFYFFDKEVK
jgi:ribosomal protein S18 acetylase RimI-like enzyme